MQKRAYPLLEGAPTADKLKQNHDYGDHEQKVNKATPDRNHDKSEDPQNDQDHSYGIKHFNIPPMTTLPNAPGRAIGPKSQFSYALRPAFARQR
jgi:hypothetical protein